MKSMETTTEERQRWFSTTRWTVIWEARNSGAAVAREALEHLCQIYWPPLYAYVRRRGYQPAVAQDLTQAFFCHFLSHNLVGEADRTKGKFRTFLLTALSNFLRGAQASARAQKRGGGQIRIALDELETEETFHLSAAQNDTPEQVFDRRWAGQILARSRDNLRQLYEQEGKLALYRRLEGWLAKDADAAQYRAAALDLEMTPGAVRTAVHRLRHRYGEMIRRELARTVSRDEEVEEEYAYLRELLAETGPGWEAASATPCFSKPIIPPARICLAQIERHRTPKR